MPLEAEKKLAAEARKKGLKGDEFNAYVFGGLRNIGWKPEREKKAKDQKDGLKE